MMSFSSAIRKELMPAVRSSGQTDPSEETLGQVTVRLRELSTEEKGSVCRYQIVRPHARGGVGEVFLAQDHELDRDVALKEIQPSLADHPECRARFVQEAVVTGRLQHPGIVPVYGLGFYADGRPYYAMRFIQGTSLQTAADRYHRPTKSKADPAARRTELRQLLRRLLDACNAIEYAHRNGVLHRDLKPANIMLGEFGETLVVDWGLAKVRGQIDPHGHVKPTAMKGSTSGLGLEMTQMGSALGTPAFMSPEQAAGHWDVAGPATDVYGLGATLYYLLTGRMPVQGKHLTEVLARVQGGDFPPPREVNPDVPASLEAVCLKAMAVRPKDRYPSAAEFAADVERWLDDQPVTAAPEPWQVRARRWVHRHHTLVAATAAALVVAILGLAATAAVLVSANGELSRAHAAESEAKNQALRQADDARRARDEVRREADEIRRQKVEVDAAHEETRRARDEARREAEEARRQKAEADRLRDEAMRRSMP